MAQNKEVIEVAYAGDIIGIHDPGYYNIGDTLTEKEVMTYTEIPDFPSEHFVKVVLEDPLTGKKLYKGLEQLSEEGATQLFRPTNGPSRPPVGSRPSPHRTAAGRHYVLGSSRRGGRAHRCGGRSRLQRAPLPAARPRRAARDPRDGSGCWALARIIHERPAADADRRPRYGLHE